MREPEQWIWLPKDKEPDRQTTRYSALLPCTRAYAVAEFERAYTCDAPLKWLTVVFSADTAAMLFINGVFVARGPASPGGDFIDNETPRPNYYSYRILFDRRGKDSPLSDGEKLTFRALVRMDPVRICEYSRGHGGFMLWASGEDTNGQIRIFMTDDAWRCRVKPAYVSPGVYDGRKADGEWMAAEKIFNFWHCEPAPIPPCKETVRYPEKGGEMRLAPRETRTEDFAFDMIWAGYVRVSARCAGEISLTVQCRELDEEGTAERFVFTKDGEYTGFELHSAGKLTVTAKNESGAEAAVAVSLSSSTLYAPETKFTCADKELDEVLRVCAHTLGICRQTLHLDSPRHCEPLACTGDYYIETLMTALHLGDMSLAAFDVRRTAELLRYHDGRMFHTSYSLIWVQMLWDVYLFTGDDTLIPECKEALTLLLDRFHTYIGDTGLIETPPDYMFLDWLAPDGVNLHHPPKALGQTCLNLFYYGALETAEKIYGWRTTDNGMTKRCRARRLSLKEAIVKHLWDAGKGLFTEGLNTPTPENLIGTYMPENVEGRHYLPHSGILAAYFGFFSPEENRALITRILETPGFCRVQPYFMHFLLEAVYRTGLRETYTLKLLELWKEPVRRCPKGLTEGFYPPTPGYGFDHSHAWGGTPLYALKKALSGLSVLTPGMEEISLSPSLLGLDYADLEIPVAFADGIPRTPVRIRMRQGQKTEITAPDGVRIHAPADCAIHYTSEVFR
ncbi:MAG: hypothetical protein IJK40_08590 [Clostridia bacterium]|nr:hypothetical protein [Clostridia bacterium]